MRLGKVLGLVNVVAGLLVALVPTVILPVCQELVETKAGRFVPMRCHYTAQSEVAVGGILAIVGVLLFVYGQKSEVLGALSAVVLTLGIVVILLPTVLIGTCGNPQMDCNVGTKPALILLGIGTMLLGGVGLWSAWRARSTPLSPATAA